MNITAKEFTETLNKNDNIRKAALEKFTGMYYDFEDVDGNEIYLTFELNDEYLKDDPNAQGLLNLTVEFNVWDYVDIDEIISDKLRSAYSVKDIEPQGDFDLEKLGQDLAVLLFTSDED